MRFLTLSAVAAAAMLAAGAAHAQTVTVRIGPDLQEQAEDLGVREVGEQADRLAAVVEREVAGDPRFQGATIELTLTDLKPNRPTFQQLADSPGLDPLRSVSIGGAEIEGEVVFADGARRPVRFDWYTHSVRDVIGFSTWQDADRAYARFAAGLTSGRLL